MSVRRKVTSTLGQTKVFDSIPPNMISGMIGHWDATQIIAANGSAISSWPSSVGAGSLVQATSANQPTFQTGVRAGRPVVRFDGNDWLVFDGSTVNAGGGFTCAVVFQAGGSGNRTILQYGKLTLFLYTAAARTIHLKSVELASASTYTSDIWERWICSRPTGTSQTATLYVDNVIKVTTATNPDTTPDSIALFVDTGVGTSFTGEVAEIVIYDHALTTTERGNLDSYLAAKWGW